MDSTTATDDLAAETNTFQENLLLEMIKEICAESESTISASLAGKVNRIISDCELTHYSGLHKISTADESTSTLLGLMSQTAAELTYDEQTELNQAIIEKTQAKIPKFTAELEQLTKNDKLVTKSRKEQFRELQQDLEEKLSVLEEQENEKVALFTAWLNHRVHHVVKYRDQSTELLNLQTKILDLKSKILHLQILQNIFTETNQSIKAYKEVHQDLKDRIKQSEQQIKKYKQILENDNESALSKLSRW